MVMTLNGSFPPKVEVRDLSYLFNMSNYPYGKSLYKPYSSWVFMGKLSPRIPRLNTINTMGTLLGVHPIVP